MPVKEGTGNSMQNEKNNNKECNDDRKEAYDVGNDEDDDNASFKSALDVSLHESFLKYSSSYILPPQPFVDFCRETLEQQRADNEEDTSDHRLELLSSSLISEKFEDALSYDEDNDSTDLSNSFEQLDHEKGAAAIPDIPEKNDAVTTKDNEDLNKQGDGGENPSACIPKPAINIDRDGAAQSDGSTKSEWISIDQETIQVRATVQSLTFNQDKTCIAVATNEGYIIRTLPSMNGNEADESTVRVHQVPIPKGGITHIQILHSTSLLAIVRKSAPRILALVHAKTARVVKELPFTSAVRRVEMNKMSLVTLTADGALHIFMFIILDVSASRQNEGISFIETIPILDSTESARIFTAQAASTSGAFFELSSHVFPVESIAHADRHNDTGESFLVTKSAEGVGIVSVYKAFRNLQQNGKPTLKLIKSFQAHGHGIARIAIGGAANHSQEKKIIATASTQGTLIRIFSLPQCEKLYDLQRGSSPCTIFSISFNYESSCIAVSSSKRTIHLFDLRNNETSCRNDGIDHHQLHPSSTTPEKWGTKISSVLGFYSDGITVKKPLRSYAKIRKGKIYKAGAPIVPTTISLVNTTEDGDEQLIVCVGGAKLFHFAVRSDGKNRPVQVNDILSFDDNIKLSRVYK